MTKRVYEIARELGLSSKQVLDRLNDAGIETKSNLASVDDTVYRRVFGNGSDSSAQDSRPELQEHEVVLGSLEPRKTRSRATRVIVYVLIALVALVLSMGIGALAAMFVHDEPSSVASKKSQPPDRQSHLQRNGKKRGDERSEKQSSDQQSEAEYVGEIGKLQNESVNTFLNSHDRLLHYDDLDAADVEEMRANEHILELIGDRVDNLDPPQKYKDQHEVFSAAVDQLHEAVQLAYALASDPTSATQSAFEEYNSHVERATTLLRRSNELLGRDYKRIEDVPKVGSSP
jgi:Translation initiation factor IF-2, N-terminal region